MIALARQAGPRGTPCEACGKPIRKGAHPKGWGRKYCDRLRCVRARLNTKSRAVQRRWTQAHRAEQNAKQRATYDPEKRHARYLALTPQQRASWRVAQRRWTQAHLAEQSAKRRATYDPEKRHARYLATGT